MNRLLLQPLKQTVLFSKSRETILLYTAIICLAFGIFFADMQTKVGIVVWVLYLIPLTLSYLSWRSYVPFLIALLVTFFMIVTFIIDLKGGIPQVIMINRTLGLTGIWAISLIGYFFIRAKTVVKKEEWIQSAIATLNESIVGTKNFHEIGKGVLDFGVKYYEAQVGAFYVLDKGGFKKAAMYGVGAKGAPDTLENDDLVQAAIDEKEIIVLDDIPDGYIQYGSAFGSSKPKYIAIVPFYSEKKTNAVMEIGFQNPIEPTVLEMLKRSAESVSIAVTTAEYRENLQKYLEETQRQSEELQAQSEELRVSNEELEEQSKVLQESQSMLEQQQAELEQSNAQMEEQTQMLELQRDDLAKTKAELQMRANELEEASQYKSDFLANMSHELRTPLNSTLILAKLLADNSDGNLTDEQVKFAKTIQSSGNDLLMLINDILDLSKIEAGHMHIEPEIVRTSKIIENLSNNFEPIAMDKGLKFTTVIEKDVVQKIETDAMRLDQVLKNLVSNAVKFTENGEVSIEVSNASKGYLSFAVKDTGIGIPNDKLDLIFQAFQQEDGTTNRKFGGTGLGLSISKELIRLLGGDITVSSIPDQGSVFTVTLPINYSGETAGTIEKNVPQEIPSMPINNISLNTANEEKVASAAKHRKAKPDVQDDRDNISGTKRVILVIEDDHSFASILYGLTRDLGFECLVAHNAEDGLELFKEFNPHAILLDVNLPDHSGLSILDSVKQNPQTRHIPIHVISAEDYSQTALAMGAMGFLSKPVKSEDLEKILKNLEDRLNQTVRRVLVVEDNKIQRESIKKLLEAPGVEIIGVGTAKSCLTKLKNETFDCMILDLSLPDGTGYSLLETLSEEEAYSFPPVIVYTGKDISREEEQKLSRYSHSIIIKGAKSPERLLDEVTLFLHKVLTDLRDAQQKMIKQAQNRDSALENKTILVVEDDIRNIYSLTSILEPKGVKVEIARNGREAVDYLNDKNNAAIDLVLMDIMMPEMDGYTAMRKIRENSALAKLPIIALTAKAMKDDQKRCLDAGANDYMSKPLDVDKLLSLIRVWVMR